MQAVQTARDGGIMVGGLAQFRIFGHAETVVVLCCRSASRTAVLLDGVLLGCTAAAQRLHVAPMSRHQTGSKDSLHMQIPLVTHVCAFPFLRPVCARRPAEVFESPQLRSDCCCHCLSAVFPCRDCFTRFNTQVTVTLSCCSVEKASSGRTWLSRRSKEAAKLEWRYWSWPYAERTFQISAPTKVVVRYWA